MIKTIARIVSIVREERPCRLCDGDGESWTCETCTWTCTSIIKATLRDARYFIQRKKSAILYAMLPSLWCPSCERFSRTIETRHQYTSFTIDEVNYITCCEECFNDVQTEWEYRWKEYYADTM